MPKVSIIITSYNHAKWLKQCVDSALSQTFQDREVILIDDNSTDETPMILNEYKNKIEIIRNNPNMGTYPSLNKAIKIAQGEYIAILNSDDYWHPNKIEKQITLMQEDPNMTFCHTFGEFVDDVGNGIQGEPMGFPFPQTPTGDCFHIFVANNTAIASSVLARTKSINQVGGFDESFKNLGDWDMWLKLSEMGNVGFLPDKLTFYRVHGSNTIHQIETTRSENLKIRQKQRENMNRILKKKGTKPAMAHTLACLGSLYSLKGENKEARKCYVESAKLMPLRFKTYLRFLLTFAPNSVKEKLK